MMRSCSTMTARLIAVCRSVIALVAATAGFPTTFTVTVRDSFGNPSDSHSLQRYNPLSGSPNTTNPTSLRFEIVVSDTVIRKVGIYFFASIVRFSFCRCRCPSFVIVLAFGMRYFHRLLLGVP